MTNTKNIKEKEVVQQPAQEVKCRDEVRFQHLADAIFEGMIIHDRGEILDFNQRIVEMLGYEPDEIIGEKGIMHLIAPESKEIVQRNIQMGYEKPYEIKMQRKDGSHLHVEAVGKPIAYGRRLAQVIALRDITVHKRAEDKLRESEDRYQSILENIEGGYFEIDLVGNMTFFNEDLYRLINVSAKKLMGMNNREYTSPGTAKELFIAFNEVYKTGIPLKSKDFKIIWKDNSRSTLELSVSLIRDQKGDPTGFRGIARDVTGKRYFEHMYRTIADQSFSGVYIIQKGVFQYINSSAAVRAGYTPEELIGGESMKIIHPDDRETTKQISDEMLKGVRKSPYVYRMITKDHTIRWIIETVKPIIFQGEQAILGNSMDITELKQAEEALTNSFISLRTALGATLQAIAIFVETRDPSTIGHQRRVSDLARAIATEMDMTKDHIEGVRMAGMIHDIGKISIPAEILRKPTKLTGNEIRLIRDHSQAGYDILKDIEFPWPIARMVLEHHERIDGSGYPQGLKRDDTLLESRILAVADVVEAMVSPRPSRPALGLDKALDEIMRNRDILYDTSVADACLHLFKEKNYKIVD